LNKSHANGEVRPRASARARLRPKAQLTLPDEIRRALHVSEGDEIEFAVDESGNITVRGYVSVPSDQVWFFTPDQLAATHQAEEEGLCTPLLRPCSPISNALGAASQPPTRRREGLAKLPICRQMTWG